RRIAPPGRDDRDCPRCGDSPVRSDRMIRHAGVPRVLMAGGGTGGHLFPGVAVAERLMKRMPGARVQLAATAKDLASRHLAACPLEIVQLHSPKLPDSPVRVPGFGVLMGRALLRSYGYLRESG